MLLFGVFIKVGWLFNIQDTIQCVWLWNLIYLCGGDFGGLVQILWCVLEIYFIMGVILNWCFVLGGMDLFGGMLSVEQRNMYYYVGIWRTYFDTTGGIGGWGSNRFGCILVIFENQNSDFGTDFGI